MNLRTATPQDHAAAVATWRASQGGLGQRPPAARVARVEEKLSEPGALLVVADNGTELVGMALGEPARIRDGAGDLEPGLVHLSMVFVVPSQWRQGLGSALVEALADAAWAQGYRNASVWSRVDNAPALAFFEACGFERSGRAHDVQDGTATVQFAAELEAPLRDIVVRSEGIRLGQLLKLAELVDTGSEGKELLAAGGVQVNGEVEERRGRQLASGDVVHAHDKAIRVVLADR